jgi:hypothetical protein
VGVEREMMMVGNYVLFRISNFWVLMLVSCIASPRSNSGRRVDFLVIVLVLIHLVPNISCF